MSLETEFHFVELVHNMLNKEMFTFQNSVQKG